MARKTSSEPSIADVFTTPAADAPDATAAVTQTPAENSTPDVVTTTEAASETPETPAAPPSWLETLKTDFGFNDVKDEAEAQARVLEALRQEKTQREQLLAEREQFRPLVQYGQQYVEEMRKQDQPSAQVSPVQPVADAGPWPTFPKVDPKEAERWFDAEKREWKFNAPPNVIRDFEQADAMKRAWADGLVNNPQQTLEPIIEHVVAQRVQQVLKEQFGMDPGELVQKLDIGGEQAYINNLLTHHEGVLFEVDPRTKKPDYQRPSAVGHEFSRLLQEAETIGIPNEANRYYYAQQRILPLLSQAQTTQQVTTAAQTVEQKKQEHLRRAAAQSTPSAAGSVPTPGSTERQNRTQTIGREFVELANSEGVFNR